MRHHHPSVQEPSGFGANALIVTFILSFALGCTAMYLSAEEAHVKAMSNQKLALEETLAERMAETLTIGFRYGAHSTASVVIPRAKLLNDSANPNEEDTVLVRFADGQSAYIPIPHFMKAEM